MANIYAPQVRAVQPAFINKNKGKIKIHFSFSPYDDSNVSKKIRYTVIDPNQSSLDGNNSMIKNANYLETAQLANTAEIFEIDLSNLKPLTSNQYYQVQLYTVVDTVVSEPSVISLIRPIDNPSVSFNFPSNLGEETIFILSGSMDKESIASYYISIINNNNNKVVHKTNNIINSYGKYFETELKYNFESGIYKFKINYITKYGYESFAESSNIEISQADETSWLLGNEVILKNKIEEGCIQITFPNNELFLQNGIFTIFRADSKENFTVWKKIYSQLNLTQGNKIYKDYLIENNIAYKYKFIYEIGTSKYKYEIEEAILAEFEDIFIADKMGQFSARYNPNITSLKKITQDSITNTLGGHYPIIRRNGETNYKQFTISGTIYSDCPIHNTSTDSCGKPMLNWMDDLTPLLLGLESLKKYQYYIAENMPSSKRNQVYNQLFRETVIDFLTDGKVKILRSPTEGNMLVYLSNVSFTPNHQLGREIYDFSATAIECDELNENNLIKYDLKLENIIENNIGDEYITPVTGNINFINSTPVLIISEEV